MFVNPKKGGGGVYQHNSETIDRIVLKIKLDLCIVVLNIMLKFENI